MTTATVTSTPAPTSALDRVRHEAAFGLNVATIAVGLAAIARAYGDDPSWTLITVAAALLILAGLAEVTRPRQGVRHGP
jgi:hypothetical protein